MKTRIICTAIISALFLSGAAARAEIALSANDGKQLRPGDTIANPTPDSISVLDIRNGRASLLGSVQVPAAMIGPPESVAMAHSGAFAIATACQALVDGKLVPSDVVSVIDLSNPAKPKVLQTVHAGMGASGVSIRADDKLALVANSKDNSISIFSISGKTLTPVGKVQLEAGAGPTDVVFAPNGKSAIAVEHDASRLAVLSVNGASVTATGRELVSGRTPYGAVITHDSKYVINTNLGGAMPPPGETPAARQRGMSRQGTVAMTDIASGAVLASVVVGPVPEHVTQSADGKYIAVVVANGSAAVRSDPKFNSVLGILQVYAVGNGTLTPVAHADSGHWCQGATFSQDGKTILLQCAAEREIEVFHFNGSSLSQDKTASIPMESRPGAIATAFSR